MKKTVVLFMVLNLFTLGAMAQESIEVTAGENAVVSEQLEKEAASQEDEHSKKFLQKVADAFRNSKETVELEINKYKEDCADCTRKDKTKNIFTKLGRSLGKGAAWLSTTTAKPFMSASGFITGVVEKGDKNKEVVALYNFFLNHQEEFDNLYLEAGTPEEMIELMLVKMEEIMEKKSLIIIKDFLSYVGVEKELPESLSDFELTNEEIAKIDMSKVDASFINNHPEYLEVKPLIGEMTNEELMDVVTSGYFDKAISFENYKDALPKPHEVVTTVVGQIFAPKIALGVVSKTLAGLYATPVIAADIGTGVSAAICLQKENQKKFKQDDDLRMFCSYVTNRSGYQLMKSRAKGYVSGKKTRQKIEKKISDIKAKRAEKKRQKELARQQEALQLAQPH